MPGKNIEEKIKISLIFCARGELKPIRVKSQEPGPLRTPSCLLLRLYLVTMMALECFSVPEENLSQ